MEKCIYCNEEAKYQFKNGKWCCSPNMNNCEEIKKLRRKSSQYIWDNGLRVLKESRIYLKLDGINKCECGCGNTAKFVLKSKKICCSEYWSKCLATRKKNSEGQLKRYKAEPFEKWGSRLKRELILKEQKGVCLHCGLKEWNRKPLILELDHISGDRYNNKRENLRLLCPNCHSQTPTWHGRDKNTGKTKVTEAEIVKILNETKDINKTLFKVSLSMSKDSYKRIRKIIEKYNIELY